MAVDNPKFGKGIGVAAGFDLGAQKPLDARETVATIEERDLHVESNRAYEGMLVYVEANQITYQYTVVGQDDEGNNVLGWKEFGFNSTDFDNQFAESIQEVDGRLDDLEEDVARLDGAVDVEGSIKKQIKDAVDAEAQLRADVDGALDERVKAIEEDLAQGGEVEARIAQAEADIDGLQGLVGKPAEGEEAASGLHLALDNAKQEALNAVNGEKERAEGQEAAIRQEMAEAIGQHAVEADPEQGVEAVEASGLRKEMDDAVAAEKGRAEGIEAGLAGRLDVIEGEGEGSIKKAVADLAARHDEEMDAVEGRVADLEALHEGENSVENQIANAKQEALNAVNGEKARAEEQEAAIRQELANEKAALQAEIDADVKAEADRAVAKEGELAQAVVDEKARAEGQEAAIRQELANEAARADAAEKANKAVLDKLDGAVDVEGSVKKQIKDAVDAVNADADALEARVKVNEDKLAVIEGEGEGSIAKALADAKAHAEQKITELVDSAPDAMNTLNELAKAINDNKGVYDAYVEEHNQAMAALKEELQGEIDDDVAAEAALRVAEEAKIRQELANEKAALQAEIDADVAAEAALRVAEEAKIRQELANEKAALQAEIDADVAAEAALRVAEEAKIRQELADEAAEIRGEVEAIVGQHAVEANPEQGVEAVEASGLRKEMDDAVAAEKARAEGQEAAIRQEFADADEALHAVIKNEMAAVIQSLSAAITEDGMLRIALGGIQGDDVLVIREQEIPFVTDEDIDEIIAGLDAPVEDEGNEGEPEA